MAIFPWMLFAQIAQEALEILEPEEGAVDALQVAELQEIAKGLKIYINTAEEQDLLQLPFLDIFQVHNLLQYRKRVRRIYGIYELLQIKGFDAQLLPLLKPYLDFHPNPEKAQWKWRSVIARGRPQMVLRTGRDLQLRAGYNPERKAAGNSHYTGDPYQALLRFRWESPNRLRFGITLAKDAGEPFAHPQQNLGFDFVSWHLEVRQYKRFEQIVVGDLGASFGQGLVLWTNFAVGKSSASQNIWRYSKGLQAYAGADENRFFRGVGIRYRLHPKLTYQVLASHKKVDATLTADTGFTTLRTSGLHRTTTELESRKNLNLRVFAHHLRYRTAGLEIGITQALTKYHLPRTQPTALYGAFHPTGSYQHVAGLDYRKLWRGVHFFGEVGQMHGRWGQVHGIQYTGHEQIQLSLHYRQLAPGFMPDYQAAFEGGTGGNRRGLFVGMSMPMGRKWHLEAYSDLMRQPWLRFGLDAPSQQADYLVQLQYRLGWLGFFVVRFRYLEQTVADTRERYMTTTTAHRHWLRLHLTQQMGANWQVSTRVEYTRNRISTRQTGWVGIQDIKWKPAHLPISVALRWASFQTDGFATALYAFEPDLPLGFSVPALFGVGTRTVMVLQHHFGWGQWGVRLGHTHYADRTAVGSGLDLTQGPYRTDLRLFFKWAPR